MKLIFYQMLLTGLCFLPLLILFISCEKLLCNFGGQLLAVFYRLTVFPIHMLFSCCIILVVGLVSVVEREFSQ